MRTERSHHPHDRGATLAEYGLLVGLVAVVCLGAIGYLGDSADEAFEMAGDAIENGQPVGGGGGSSGGSSPTPTSPTSPTSPSTPSTASPSPTTPTTAPPAPTTSTTSASYSGPASAGFSGVSATEDGWNWESRATVTLTGTDGEDIPDGAVVEIRMVTIDERRRDPDEQSVEVFERTITDGRIDLVHEHSSWGSDDVDVVRYEIVDVTFPDSEGPEWDGESASVTIDAP